MNAENYQPPHPTSSESAGSAPEAHVLAQDAPVLGTVAMGGVLPEREVLRRLIGSRPDTTTDDYVGGGA